MERVLFDIDDLIEEIEEKYGKVEELTEGDCMDIIYNYVGHIKLNTAYYDKQFSCIIYEPEEEDDDVFLEIYLESKRAKYLGFD